MIQKISSLRKRIWKKELRKSQKNWKRINRASKISSKMILKIKNIRPKRDQLTKKNIKFSYLNFYLLTHFQENLWRKLRRSLNKNAKISVKIGKYYVHWTKNVKGYKIKGRSNKIWNSRVWLKCRAGRSWSSVEKKGFF